MAMSTQPRRQEGVDSPSLDTPDQSLDYLAWIDAVSKNGFVIPGAARNDSKRHVLKTLPRFFLPAKIVWRAGQHIFLAAFIDSVEPLCHFTDLSLRRLAFRCTQKDKSIR
jgi:hypothetical protein